MARAAGDSAKEAEIELGKGFALLQLKDPASMARAQTCLEKTKAIATASGNEAQVKFVQMIIDTNGMIETELGGGAGCGDEGGKPKPCDGGDDLAEKLAVVQALHSDPASPWTAQLDLALVKVVAEHGTADWVSIETRPCRKPPHLHTTPALVDMTCLPSAVLCFRFDRRTHTNPSPPSSPPIDPESFGTARHQAATTAALNRELARGGSEACGDPGSTGGGQPLTATMVEHRWALLTPTLKEEFADQEKERACGHSCGSCPTRPACQLHDALETDIEDTKLFRAPPPASLVT